MGLGGPGELETFSQMMKPALKILYLMSELESGEQGFHLFFQGWNMASIQMLGGWWALDGQWEGDV